MYLYIYIYIYRERERGRERENERERNRERERAGAHRRGVEHSKAGCGMQHRTPNRRLSFSCSSAWELSSKSDEGPWGRASAWSRA